MSKSQLCSTKPWLMMVCVRFYVEAALPHYVSINVISVRCSKYLNTCSEETRSLSTLQASVCSFKWTISPSNLRK